MDARKVMSSLLEPSNISGQIIIHTLSVSLSWIPYLLQEGFNQVNN
jgi:hypothetical protein